jgi:single-stranded-DNA-specific exonuclease
MKFRWSPAPAQPLLTARLARQLNISTLLAQCLVNRQLEEPQIITDYLEPRLRHLADPFLLPDVTLAVDRLYLARERAELVVIFGDYDVDGVTSTALLLEFLRALGWRVEFHLPHRLEEGYGLTLESVERCLKKAPTHLLVALDCGSTSVDTIQSLCQQGIDVIVVDHHQVSTPRPQALALVNPRVRGDLDADGRCASGVSGAAAVPPFAELCSVGLAFKLAHALLKRARQTNLPGAADYDLRTLLDLVALGTIADLVPLTGENRILVSAGLERLNRTERPGLLALKKVARSGLPLGVYEVGFQLAPRLNAAGRLETAEDALHLLLAANTDEAMARAEKLEVQNRERQTIERAIADEAIGHVRAKFKPEEDFVIVEGNRLWHVGVVGIVASRVLHQFNRPTIIVGGEGDEWRGSGRSIIGFDLAAALRKCADVLVRHGGHAMAAGLTIRREEIDTFRTRLNEVARLSLKPEELCPVLRLDAEVGLEEVTLECLASLFRLYPTGQGNPPVHFYTRNLSHHRSAQRMGAEKQHVKMWVTDGVVTHEAVWWGAGNESLPAGQYDLAFVPQVNEYNGRRLVQLKVLDWRPSDHSLSRGTAGAQNPVSKEGSGLA